MAALTGVQGAYAAAVGEYRPPAPFSNWQQVADQKRVRLQVGEGYEVVSARGEVSVANGKATGKKAGRVASRSRATK